VYRRERLFMAILRSSLATAALCAVSALPGCSAGAMSHGSSTGGESGGTGGSSSTGGFVTAKHPALPQVLDLGGPVLTAPKVQPIAYAGDTERSSVESFLQELASTSYWGEVTSEYGVGALTVLPTIVLTTPAPATLTDATVQQSLASNTTGANPAWGAADPSTIYLFLIPPGTIISATGPNSIGCTDFDGYHDESPVTASLSVPYAVGCSCPGFDGPTITDLEERTVALSHELVEASTDPFPNTDPAYVQEDNADIVWTLVSGGEVADMCEFNLDSYYIPPGSTYMVQRIWSDEAAKASTNPCVPVPATGPYFNSVPALPDTLELDAGSGETIPTVGVKVAVGASMTIPVDLFSDAPTSGPWKVTVYDGNYLTGGTAELDLSLDNDTGENGDTLNLTIKVMKADPTYGVESFVLFSDLGGQENIWMGMVGQ
jgi:hypothetical protein